MEGSADAEEPRHQEVVGGHDDRGAGQRDRLERRELQESVGEDVGNDPGCEPAYGRDNQAGIDALPSLPAADNVLDGVDSLVIVAVVHGGMAGEGKYPGEPEQAEEGERCHGVDGGAEAWVGRDLGDHPASDAEQEQPEDESEGIGRHRPPEAPACRNGTGLVHCPR